MGESDEQQQQSKLFDELCALLLASLRTTRCSQISPAGFPLLVLGASFALVLCGSVTFVLGCILMPCVMGLVMVLYFVGIVSSLSDIGKAILCPTARASPKEVSGSSEDRRLM